MPSVRYYNQTAPFWDFLASMEEQASSHPWATQNRGDASGNDEQAGPWNPWVAGFPFGAFPHRGGHGGPHPHQRGPPPPPGREGASPPPNNDGPPAPAEGEQGPQPGPSEPGGSASPSPHRGPAHRGRCGGRGGWGGRGRGGPRGFPFGPNGFGNLAELFQSQLFGAQADSQDAGRTEDFKPEVDVFDTPSSFVVHVSLPGAKKEDIAVSWDAEKSELVITGVVYRPGDEELLETLALDERKVGALKRNVRLGSRANPAQVDVEGISAKMEDGVLRVEVPKLESGFVEVKKVDIE